MFIRATKLATTFALKSSWYW